MTVSKSNQLTLLLVALGILFLPLIMVACLTCDSPQLVVKIDATQPDAPIFDFRAGRFYFAQMRYVLKNDCYLQHFEVQKIDSKGQTLNTSWKIETLPETDQPSFVGRHAPDFVEYGKPPLGWKQVIDPHPLRNGIYRTTGSIVFVRKGNHYVVLPGHYYTKEAIVKQLRKMGETSWETMK